jgi:hypothetical protein
VQSTVRTVSLPGGDEVRAVMQQRLVHELQQLQLEVAAAQAALGCNSSRGAADGTVGATLHGCSSSSSSTEDLTDLLPGVGARLMACGEALAALRPVPLCCNNPGCVELRGASELQLVAGKGSQCSRCRWVHGWHPLRAYYRSHNSGHCASTDRGLITTSVQALVQLTPHTAIRVLLRCQWLPAVSYCKAAAVW